MLFFFFTHIPSTDLIFRGSPINILGDFVQAFILEEFHIPLGEDLPKEKPAYVVLKWRS